VKKTIVYIGIVAVIAAITLIAIVGCNNDVNGTNDSVDNFLSRFDLTEYTVTFNGNGGGDAPYATTVRTGTNITLPGQENMVKDGYDFGGWRIGETIYPAGSLYTVTDNATLHAVWNLVVPNVPTNVNATAESSSSIMVTWSPVSWAIGYNVYRYVDSSDEFIIVGSVVSTSYTDNELSAGTTYHYMVSAYNSAGESARSSPRVGALTTPDAPPMVTARAVSSTGITVEWPPVFGAVGYNVYRSTNLLDSYGYPGGYLYSTTSTSFTNNGLSAGTTYYYKISAYNSSGESEISSSYGSPTTIPDVPVCLITNAVSSNSITINWCSVTGATGYNVYRGPSSSGTYSYLYNKNSTSFTNNGLSSNTNYCYKVSAYNSGGESDVSSAICTITAPDVPACLAVSVTSSSNITISWCEVTGATGYNVYRGTNSSGSTYSYLYSTTSASFTNNGLSSNTSYCYKVSAYNDGGESEHSFFVCSTTRN